MNRVKRSPLSWFVASCMTIAVLGIFQGCNKSSGPSGDVRVFGVVTKDGSPAANVEVNVPGADSTKTDDKGNYEIWLDRGEYEVLVANGQADPIALPVSVGAEPEVQLDIDLDNASRSGDFTCEPGVRVERRVSSPGRVEFDVTNMRNGNNKEHIAWGYEPFEQFWGGKTPDGAQWGLRTYKLKVFGRGGHFVSEPRFNVKWDPSQTYHVVCEWDHNSVVISVDGVVVAAVGAEMPGEFVVGVGWPPAIRGGISGARFSNIKWPAGSIPLN